MNNLPVNQNDISNQRRLSSCFLSISLNRNLLLWCLLSNTRHQAGLFSGNVKDRKDDWNYPLKRDAGINLALYTHGSYTTE